MKAFPAVIIKSFFNYSATRTALFKNGIVGFERVLVRYFSHIKTSWVPEEWLRKALKCDTKIFATFIYNFMCSNPIAQVQLGFSLTCNIKVKSCYIVG